MFRPRLTSAIFFLVSPLGRHKEKQVLSEEDAISWSMAAVVNHTDELASKGQVRLYNNPRDTMYNLLYHYIIHRVYLLPNPT